MTCPKGHQWHYCPTHGVLLHGHGHGNVLSDEAGNWCTCTTTEVPLDAPREGHERKDYWTNSYQGKHGQHQPWTPLGRFQKDYDENKRVQPQLGPDDPDFQTDYEEALRMDAQFTVGRGPRALIRIVGKTAGFISVVDVTTGRPYNIPHESFMKGLESGLISTHNVPPGKDANPG
jgi:hypothetical protein